MVNRSLLVLGTLLLFLVGGQIASAAPVMVTITSTPPGAAVYIDGKQKGVRGNAGETFKLRLEPGSHQVLLELDGYKPKEETVNIGKKAMRLSFILERAPARVAIRAPAASDDATGGEIFVDGVAQGTVPREVEMKEGSHLIEVRKAGYKVHAETIEVRSAESRTLMITLKPEIRRGTLVVTTPSEAQVWVDGTPRGQSPAFVELDEGEHAIEIRRPDVEGVLWQQKVAVKANQQTRVQAEYKVPEKTGSLLVIAPNDAEVVIDGTRTAKPNAEISGLKVGQHVIQVQGKAYVAVTKVVEIEANKQKVETVNLTQSAEARGVGTLRVVMTIPVEGAQYFLNGRPIPERELLKDGGLEVPSGANVVVVRREGMGQVTKTVNVPPGQSTSVALELKNVGRLHVESIPQGAQVLLDGAVVGQTPFTSEEVAGGAHMVEVRQAGFQPYIQQVVVRGGEQANVQAALGEIPKAPPPPARPDMHASLSAITNDPGRFTVDIGAGYPYFLNAGLQVGAFRRGMFGFDVGVDARTFFFTTEVGVRARAHLFTAGPIAGGLSLSILGGGGPRNRNSFSMELGAPITLVAGRFVQLTARPMLQVWSDRFCPDSMAANSASTEPLFSNDRCVVGEGMDGTPNAIADARAGKYDPKSAAYQVDGTGVLERFTGARFAIQASLEVYVTRFMNFYALLEGAPGLSRQLYTGRFSLFFPSSDIQFYGRAGVTFKY